MASTKLDALKRLNEVYEQIILLSEAEDENDQFSDSLNSKDSNESDEPEGGLKDDVSSVIVLKKIYDAIIIIKTVLNSLISVVSSDDLIRMRLKLEQFHKIYNTFIEYYGTYDSEKRDKVLKLFQLAITTYLKELMNILSNL